MKILYQLQLFLAQMLELITKVSTPLYQVLITKMAVLLQLHQFYDTIWDELPYKSHYF